MCWKDDTVPRHSIRQSNKYMMRRILQLAFGLAMLLLVSCEKEENMITLSTPGTAELYSVTNQTTEVRFTAEESWKASCLANWLTFSPKSGKSGENVITIASTSTNRTKQPRTAVMTIEAGGKTTTVHIKQRDEYAVFETDELYLTSQPKTVDVYFSTNVEPDQLFLYSTDGLEKWVKAENKARTRAEYKGYINSLYITANESRDPREGAFFLVMKDQNGALLGLDTLFVYQEGAIDNYCSFDYSQDGKVKLLNQATEGKGIPIVLMGDGFVDREIADSTYAQTMKQAMENLFSEEPMKSLRNYFNVYQVTAVSSYNRFAGFPTTTLGAMVDHQTTGITVNADRVMDYVKRVENIDSIHALAVVIMNTNQDKGMTYMIRNTKKVDYSYAIALCPIIESLESERFRQVLTHEAVGHGFAKLADEYVRSTEGSATEADIKELKEMHEKWSWFLNVDSEKDSTKVLWSRFIFDSEFANEKIGTYEGGYTFFKGVYRPSEGSMMNQNDAPFNAPSRRAIYNKVMELGLDQHPSYEDFVEFDRQHKPEKWSYKTRTRQIGWDSPWLPAPPRIIWR